MAASVSDRARILGALVQALALLGLACPGCPRAGPAEPPAASSPLRVSRPAAAALPPNVGREGDVFVNLRDGAALERVSAGYYGMGRDGGPPEEGPAHEVFLDEFFIYRLEVSRAQFARFLDASGREDGPSGLERKDGRWTPAAGTGGLPVTDVSWEDASAYARWAEGELPTEAQWEAAARGVEAGPYPWGADAPDAGRCRFGMPDAADLAPADALPKGRSPFGCLNMAGNAAEWCLDTFAGDALSRRGGLARNPVLLDTRLSKAVRGGGVLSPASACTVFSRTGLSPETRLAWIGFRVAIAAKR